jgi:hypothetical protein
MSATLLTDGAMLISTRVRTVWTTHERKLLDRLAKVFNMHGDKLQLRCGNPVCPDNRISLAQDHSSAGGAVLRCGCTDRVFTRSC